MFLVSRGFSWVKSGDLVWGSDSPVSEELSTCRRGKASVLGGHRLAAGRRAPDAHTAGVCANLPCSRWQK